DTIPEEPTQPCMRDLRPSVLFALSGEGTALGTGFAPSGYTNHGLLPIMMFLLPLAKIGTRGADLGVELCCLWGYLGLPPWPPPRYKRVPAEKKLPLSDERKRHLVELNHPLISVRRQCELL